MANSLEFSPSGHPIENRYDAYGEFLADSLPEDPETTRENQDRITRRIDAQRAAFLASGVPDDFDPFAPLSEEDERQERIVRLEMKHDPNDPFCPCEDCMKVARAVHDDVVKSTKPAKINRLDPAFEDAVRDYCKPGTDDSDRKLRKRPDGEYESGTTCDWLHFWNAATTWQPIATAPKDGAALVYDMGIHIACYDAHLGEWESLHESDSYGHPTKLKPLFWMPMPSSPTQDMIADALRKASLRERDRRDREDGE